MTMRAAKTTRPCFRTSAVDAAAVVAVTEVMVVAPDLDCPRSVSSVPREPPLHHLELAETAVGRRPTEQAGVVVEKMSLREIRTSRSYLRLLAHAQRAQEDQSEGDGDREDHKCICGGHMPVLQRELPLIGLAHQNREIGAAERRHDGEDLEGEDGAQDERGLDAGPEERQGDAREALPGTG